MADRCNDGVSSSPTVSQPLIWTTRLVERLINEVQLCTFLWHENVAGHKDGGLREKAWEKISKACDRPVHECVITWRKLSKKYKDERKRLNMSSGAGVEGEVPQSPWPFYERLRFLDRVINPKNVVEPLTNVSGRIVAHPHPSSSGSRCRCSCGGVGCVSSAAPVECTRRHVDAALVDKFEKMEQYVNKIKTKADHFVSHLVTDFGSYFYTQMTNINKLTPESQQKLKQQIESSIMKIRAEEEATTFLNDGSAMDNEMDDVDNEMDNEMEEIE